MALPRALCRLVCSSLIPVQTYLSHHPLTALCLISPSVPLSPTAIRAPGPVPQRGTILASTPLKTAVSPLTTDSLPRLSIIDISRPIGHSFLITDPSLPDSPTLARGPSLRTLTSRSTSSASLSVKSDIKRVNRSAALACLEGRERAIPRKIQLNFMSMSDDEDEDDSFTPLCYPSTDRVVDQRLSAIPLPSSGEKEVETFSSDLYVAPSSQQSRMAPVKSRDRSRAIESWFPPLANFIDLRNEEDTPKWRSFIELSTATA